MTNSQAIPTTPSAFAKAILELTPLAQINERSDLLVFSTDLASTNVRRIWSSLREAPPPFLSKIYITSAESDAQFDATAPFIDGERFRITVHKPAIDGQLFLFFSTTIDRIADDLKHAHYIQIADMAPNETFTTQLARYQPWALDEVIAFSPVEPLADPRKFVKDFTNDRIVPEDLRPWLLRVPPTHKGPAFQQWTRVSTIRLLAALSDQVSRTEASLTFNFSGPPTQALKFSDSELAVLAEGVQAAAAWVFMEGTDTDTRHLLLANEWARTFRLQELDRLGERSLESARAAYSAYVKAGSRETLKALADLRKAVAEETQKITQKSQDLASGLWKDLPVAAAPFVLKILPDTAKISNSLVAGWIAFAAAAFLAFSYCIQVYIIGRFFKHQDNSRVVWRQVLHVVLSKSELDQFSENPITEAQQDYTRVRFAVGVVYALLAAALITLGWIDIASKQEQAIHSNDLSPGQSKDPPKKTQTQ